MIAPVPAPKFRVWHMGSLVTLGVLSLSVAAAAAPKFQPLPLGSAANSTFTDDTANDRRGGWIDDGSRDLGGFAPGPVTAAGVPFEVVDEGKGGKSCIVLGGKARDYLPRKAELALGDGIAGDKLYLLHAAAYPAEKHSMAGILTLTYRDGKTKELHVRNGRDVVDWWNSNSARNAARAWSRYNSDYGGNASLFVSKFALENKPLAAIRFEADTAAWMIVGATIGDDTAVAGIPRVWRLRKTHDQAPANEGAEALAGASAAGGNPRNIILIVGDGMGQGAVQGASIAVHGATGKLLMEQLPVTGLMMTYSADSDITESAASATAFSGGYKTNNSTLGMSPDGKAYKSIAEAARDSGRSVGLITTDNLTGATPAAFLSHVPKRSLTDEIAVWVAGSRFDFLVGGGIGQFLPNSRKPGKRKDGRDLVQEMRAAGYAFGATLGEVMQAPSGKVLGLVDWGRHAEDVTALAQVAANGFARLDRNPKGFFIMVECSLPDGGGHGNDPDKTVDGVMNLDFVLRAALDFAKDKGDTLVVVTADHETGGIQAIADRMDARHPIFYYTNADHTAAPVPLFAFGPGSDAFRGCLENTAPANTFAHFWGLKIGFQNPLAGTGNR